MMSAIEKAFYSEYTCPVCIEVMTPPIRQCETGHAMCSSCFPRLKRCPTCRGSLSATRAILMENLYERVTFPCKYKDDGCRYMAKGEFIIEHQPLCPFAEAKCPFKSTSKCAWIGPTVKIFKHCKDNHTLFVRKGRNQKFTEENLLEISEETTFFYLIRAYERVFKLAGCWYPDGQIRWRIILIGPEEDIMKYSVKFDCGKFSDIGVVDSYLDFTNNTLFGIGSGCTSGEIVGKVCKENNGDFIFKVRIVKVR